MSDTDEGRRDRTGELPVVDADAPCACDNGWWGEDSEGHPRACLRCKPHLRRSEIERRLPLGGRRARRPEVSGQ